MTLALAMGWSSRGPCLKAQTGKGGTIPNSGVVTDPTNNHPINSDYQRGGYLLEVDPSEANG